MLAFILIQRKEILNSCTASGGNVWLKVFFTHIRTVIQFLCVFVLREGHPLGSHHTNCFWNHRLKLHTQKSMSSIRRAEHLDKMVRKHTHYSYVSLQWAIQISKCWYGTVCVQATLAGFDWGNYLEKSGLLAAPVSCFRHVSDFYTLWFLQKCSCEK